MARIDVDVLGEYIREQRDAAQLSLRQLARTAGVSNPYLSQVERGLKRPSAEILSKIAAALAISAESLYLRAGILQAREGDPEVTSSLATDPTLTERQRQTLLEMYAAFQLTNAAASRDTRADAPTNAGGTDPAPRNAAADPDRDPREDTA
jgi:transcriptional regulator with XRE-family HTH domain